MPFSKPKCQKTTIDDDKINTNYYVTYELKSWFDIVLVFFLQWEWNYPFDNSHALYVLYLPVTQAVNAHLQKCMYIIYFI